MPAERMKARDRHAVYLSARALDVLRGQQRLDPRYVFPSPELVLVSVVLYFPASKAGRSFARSVCANAEKSIEEKRQELRNASIVLWPALPVAAFLGVTLASVLRGA